MAIVSGRCRPAQADAQGVLSREESNLLLYCLVLEDQVTVTLSPAALGRDNAQGDVTFEGPLRHKMGGAKPHGAGSVHICTTTMQLQTDVAARLPR